MLCNYHFLQHLAPALHQKLVGKNLLACYSQDKDELMMEFGDQNGSFFIKAILKSQFTCLAFPYVANRARKNSVTLFDQAINKTVNAINVVQNDRSIVMYLTGGLAFLFKMHGNRSNILLFENDVLIGLFNHHLKKDATLTLANISRKLDQSLQAWLQNPDIHTAFPTLGKEVTQRLTAKAWHTLNTQMQWEMIVGLVKEMQQSNFYIESIDGPPVLTFFPVTDTAKSITDPIAACNQLYRQYNQVYLVDDKKLEFTKTLDKKLVTTKNYLNKSYSKLEELLQKRPYSEIADVLMANLHQIEKGATSVELDDFYTGKKINVKLTQGISPQKIAENYYRKSKNQAKEVEILMANLQRKENELQNINDLKQTLEKLQDAKSIKKFAEIHHLELAPQQNENSLPYHAHEYMGYIIYVGKNAKANDELIRLHASKNDLWLHARDTAGSHVIIKERSSQNFPEPVIEYAARLAASNSKAKNDTLCPVIYTPRKYVRKAKNLAPGQVIVEKEKVILVPPGI